MSKVTSVPNSVLVVDDEVVVLQIFKKLMAARGLSVRTTERGEEALDLLRREGFGCVLTDKNLPGIDGVEVMRAVRKEQPHCACILMTGYASAQSAIEALRLGATDYLEKPFPDIDLVIAKVEKAIHQQQVQLERNVFLEQLKTYQHELARAGEEARKQRTEIEMFEQILAVRVRQATQELREKCTMLESVLSTSRDSDFAVKLHAESILEYLREVQFLGTDDVSAIARALVAQLTRRLESHIGLLEHLKREPAPSAAKA